MINRRMISFTGQTFPLSDNHPPIADLKNRSFRNPKPSNIVLMGPPGSGKSSVARYLASVLNHPLIDIDDDHLEPTWGTTVANKLKELGDKGFIEAEGEALMKLNCKNSIISLSGSNPLHARAMESVAKDGIIVYLDIDGDDILQRCQQMKVDRIVGQATRSLDDILAWRRSVYERSYDIRIIIPRSASVESIGQQIIQQLKFFSQHQNFISTRGYFQNEKSVTLEFLDVVRSGLAPDRGLFVASGFLPFEASHFERLKNLSYPEIALRVLERFPLGSLHPSALRELLYSAYSRFSHPSVLPIRHLQGHHYLMETFHGPTASFKDLSLQLLPSLLKASLQTPTTIFPASESKNTQIGLLVATSGDTGTAALSGFLNMDPPAPVTVLYPKDGVSTVQKAQMLTAQGPVNVIGIDADFDFCQNTVKDIFSTSSILQKYQSIVPGLLLTSANSINWGRFLPQTVFAVSSYIRLLEQGAIKLGDPFDLVIPTGNFGNLLGAVYARRLGVPIRQLVCASNENNILTDFIETGVYDLRNRHFKTTISPAIDILISSNLERFLHLLTNGDSRQIRTLFHSLTQSRFMRISPDIHRLVKNEVKAGWCNEKQCIDTIRDVFQQTKFLIDPHTAVAKFVADRISPINNNNDNNNNQKQVPMVICSTAHFAKFPNTMLDALGLSSSLKYSHASQVPINNLQQEISTQISTLMAQQPNPACQNHPDVERLINVPIQKYQTAAADVGEINRLIENFLKEFQANRK